VFVTFLFLGFSVLSGQERLSGKVIDETTGEPLPGAVVASKMRRGVGVSADANGFFEIRRDAAWGDSVAVSYVGHETRIFALPNTEAHLVFALRERSTRLQNVVVTATESRTMTSSSVIQKKAMEHLQPSSFADVLELVPGGMAQDPSLTAPNTIALREAGISSSNYNTSSLGTSFLVDGAPISTNANMQFMDGAWDTRTTSRDLSIADFEINNESSETEVVDPNNQNVPDMIIWYQESKSVFVMHNRGFMAYALAKPEITKEEFLANNFYTYYYKFVFGDRSFDMDGDAYILPNAWVIDAVNLSVEAVYEWNVTSATLDAGWSYCGKTNGDKNRYNKSVIRKKSGNKWVDTNNSTNDFEPEAKASMLK
jgi:hypothetical protein